MMSRKYLIVSIKNCRLKTYFYVSFHWRRYECSLMPIFGDRCSLSRRVKQKTTVKKVVIKCEIGNGKTYISQNANKISSCKIVFLMIPVV